MLLFGVALIVMMIFRPQGILPPTPDRASPSKSEEDIEALEEGHRADAQDGRAVG